MLFSTKVSFKYSSTFTDAISISALNILETIQSLRVDDDDELNVQCDVFEEELNADSDAMESMNDGKVNLNDHMSVFNAIYKRVGETAAR